MSKYLTAIKAAGIAMLLLAVFAAGYHSNHGAEKVQAKWDKETADRTEAENAALLDRITENALAQASLDINKQKLKVQYENELSRSAAQSAAAERLRIPAPDCSKPPAAAKADSPSGSNADGSATRMVSERSEQDFKQLELKMETVFASCRVAQQFIRDNGMAP